jgi:hypothetical protein
LISGISSGLNGRSTAGLLISQGCGGSGGCVRADTTVSPTAKTSHSKRGPTTASVAVWHDASAPAFAVCSSGWPVRNVARRGLKAIALWPGAAM